MTQRRIRIHAPDLYNPESERPPEPGEVALFRDWIDGDDIWLLVENIFESEAGLAARGTQYETRECHSKDYMKQRALPLDQLVKAAATRPGRSRAAGPRATIGRCEHCGEPTRGGRFLPGHDAKLKGELIREATPEADAEREIRGWGPALLPGSKKLVEQGESFLRERVMNRIGEEAKA
jgi:hypothetical protein